MFVMKLVVGQYQKIHFYTNISTQTNENKCADKRKGTTLSVYVLSVISAVKTDAAKPQMVDFGVHQIWPKMAHPSAQAKSMRIAR